MISVMYNGNKYLWSNILTQDIINNLIVDSITSTTGLDLETFRSKVQCGSPTYRSRIVERTIQTFNNVDAETTLLQLYEKAVRDNRMALLTRNEDKSVIVAAYKIDEMILDNPEELNQFRKYLVDTSAKIFAQYLGVSV